MKKTSSIKRSVFILLIFMVYSIQIFAQTKKVQGNVVDSSTGEPLIGVTVSEEGTTQGTLTDIDGQFIINVKPNATLKFVYMGYTPQAVKVGTNSTLTIKLVEDTKLLDEVVVVGYGVQKKSDVTGSVTSVPKDRLTNIPVTNVLQAIQGAAAGINISQSSSIPGDAPSTVIRGQNSIKASSEPYVVVDGIPISKTGGSIADINPNDIASMEILKDASAVAIYGTNGANGVILITTKRGSTGKPQIRYNGYFGFDQIAHILEPRNGQEYVQKYTDWFKAMNNGQLPPNPVPNYGELENYNAGKTTDWIDLISRNGIIQDHNVSISGGTKDVKYFVSGGYTHHQGVLKGYDYKKTSIRSNLDADVTNFLTVGTSLFLTNHNKDGGRTNLLVASAMSPYAEPYNADGSYKIHPMNPEQLYANPLLGLTKDQERRTLNININGYADVKFSGVLDGLKYKLNVGYSYFPDRYSGYTGRAANDLNGTAEIRKKETSNVTIENIVSYARDFEKHHIDLTGLYSMQQRYFQESYGKAIGFVNDALSFNNLSAGATQSSSSNKKRYRANSQMGRLNYSYDSRYLFTFTVRRDGSSVFGDNTSKYGTFPSLAVGWNIANEKFMGKATSKFLDVLKLRLSHGKSGNEAIDVYQTISTLKTEKLPSNGSPQTSLTLNDIMGNKNLEWEKTTSTNLGLDFAIFSNRFTGTIDMYTSTTKDLLLQRAIPFVSGYRTVFDNIGKTSNKGIEITLTSRNIETKDFGWTTSVTFSHNKNKILDIYGDGKDDISNGWFIGKPINVVYTYKMVGIWQEDEIANGDQLKIDPNAKAGDIKFADLDGNGQITEADRKVQGQKDPKWIGGLTNTFRYKNWNLNVFIQTAQGMTRANQDLSYGDESGRRNTPREVKYWTPENRSNSRPSLTYYNARGYSYPKNASYTRLKDVTLSYVFDQSAIQKIGLGGLTLYASGRNLFTITDWIGWDPESRQIGRGSSNWEDNYPAVRSIVFGINLTLK